MGINFYYDAEVVRISLDETVSEQDLKRHLTVFEKVSGKQAKLSDESTGLKADALRKTEYLTHLGVQPLPK